MGSQVEARAIVPAWKPKILRVRLESAQGSPWISNRWEKRSPPWLQAWEKKDPYQQFIDSLHWLSEKPDIEDIEETRSGISDPNEVIRNIPEHISRAVRDGTFGIPARMFRTAMVHEYGRLGLKKLQLVGAMIVDGDDADNQLVTIHSDWPPEMMFVQVKLRGEIYYAFRAKFPSWWTTLTIRYDPGILEPADVIKLLEWAGRRDPMRRHNHFRVVSI